METKGFEHHDHHHCIATALSTAEEACKAQGL